MAKKSNKNKNSSPYWFWFIEVGREQFHRKYGRQYNHDCDDDRALITQLWDPVKEVWDKKVKNRKGDLRGILRELYIEDEILDSEHVCDQKTTHGSSTFELSTTDSKLRINRKLVILLVFVFLCDDVINTNPRNTTTYVPGERMEDVIYWTGSDFLMHRKVSAVFTVIRAQHPNISFLADFSSVVLQFIAVYPYTVAFSSIGDFLVYPAEIAFTHFTLANGTSSCWSKLINFDSSLFYGGGLPAWDQSNVVRNATSLDFPLKQSVGVAPQEVWKMLWERRSARAITVCDASQMLMLDRALFFLASTVGESQLASYREFMSTMVTAQDLVAALALHKANVTRANLPDTLTVECIDQEFKRLRETSRCCSYHQSRPPNHGSRQLCALAKTDVLIDTTCTMCFAGDLANFRALYKADVHSAGIVDVGTSDRGSDQDSIGASTSTTNVVGDTSPDFELEESRRGFVLIYRVVKTVPETSPPREKITVDLTTAISRLLRDPSLLPIDKTRI
ncbi:hypothetical protein ANCCAN_10541 [Ancylostoma caninum]|uniref:Uncharacterized protein n=1 Tax=Ancylostoma caninum TaxID=29170 RepID=A0A368GJP3_ANCCA|nr:hypothetical protein ANCCAN_10541 [Ancylostoma caninum]